MEFQPRDFSRGSYLNVGCMWLWSLRSHIAFEVGFRIEEFCPFENEGQFAHDAERLTSRAVERMKDYRRLFHSIRSVSDYYVRNVPTGYCSRFNAAIAHALAGRKDIAVSFLSACAESTDDDPRWVKEASADVQQLLELAATRINFVT